MTAQTKLAFWGGLDTIGGNIISIQYEDYRIITDFGALAGVNIMDLLSKETTSSLLEENKLRKIEGLWKNESLKEVPEES
mgnify:CR=1 FL=1